MTQGVPIPEPMVRRAIELYYKGTPTQEIHARCGISPNSLWKVIDKHERNVDAAIAKVGPHRKAVAG